MAETSSGFAHFEGAPAIAPEPTASTTSASAPAPILRLMPTTALFGYRPYFTIRCGRTRLQKRRRVKHFLEAPMSPNPDEPVAAIDLTEEGVHWDLRETMSYGDYLCLDQLLSCQRPRAGEHDEILFIIIHQ